MNAPKFEWKPFDKDNPPMELDFDETCLIIIKEDLHRDGKWTFHVDVANACGNYLDGYWDTENDWDEGQPIEVLFYARIPTTFDPYEERN